MPSKLSLSTLWQTYISTLYHWRAYIFIINLKRLHICNIDKIMITKYINQLEEYARLYDVNLITMFKIANVPTSTYYRAKNGVDLRFDTANKVAEAIRSIPLQNKPHSN